MPVNSFGGTTIRLLVDLLFEGSKEEQEASCEDISPLFTGGKGALVKTVCCISSPHRGSTLYEAWPGFARSLEWFGLTASRMLGISNLRGIYDFKLDQFGFSKGKDERLSDSIRRIRTDGRRLGGRRPFGGQRAFRRTQDSDGPRHSVSVCPRGMHKKEAKLGGTKASL